MKTYKPVRVVNPTAECHTTRLYPCQGMMLKLRRPALFLTACSDEAEFEVTLFSDYLLIEEEEFDEETGDKVYFINQKYDLTDWEEYGEALLGEIQIKIVNNKHEKAEDFKTTICVVQSGNSGHVLTVVNPVGSTVKMEPHQILEIVLSEGDWNNYEPGKLEAAGLRDKWTLTEIKSDDTDISLREIKHEIAGDRSEVLTKEEGHFAVKNRYDLKANPRLGSASRTIVEMELKSLKKPLREHHFWFVCTDESIKKVRKLRNDVYEMVFFNIEGVATEATGEQLTTWRGLDVRLAVHGKNKHKMHPYYLNPDSVEHKMEIVKRSEDRQRAILTNPLSIEQVDFNRGYSEITIEIIQPSVLWADLDDSVRWEASAEQSNHLQKRYVKVDKLSDYYRWGKTFQRFRITHDYKQKDDRDTEFLGAIIFTCPNKQDCHDGRKRVSCWMTVGTKETKSSIPITTPPPKKTNHHHSNNNGKKKGKEYNGTPQVCTVQFEELDVSSLEGSAKTKRFTDIWWSSGWTNHSHTSCCERDFYPASSANPNLMDFPKKKDLAVGRQQPTPTTSYQKESTNGSGGSKSGSSERSSSTAGTTGRTDPSTFIIYNAGHMHRIAIKCNQALIIRMASPAKLFSGRCEGEYWSLSHPQDEAIRVCYFRTTKIGESVYQEARIEVAEVPAAPGLHHVGCLKFECSIEQRMVFVECNVTNSADVKPRLKHMRVTTPTKCFDGTNGRRLFINDWKHNDAVIVNASELFYLRNPSSTSVWDSLSWRLEIEQLPLPVAVWNQDCLKDVLRDIDIYNPWFKTSHPLQLNNTYVFRPLNVQQPHADLILKAASRVVADDFLTVAKLTFSNSKYPSASKMITPFGVLESEYRISRSLGLCVNIKDYRKEVYVKNPADADEISLSRGQSLLIRLTPRFVKLGKKGDVECPWYIGPYPSNILDFKGMNRVDGDNVFKFQVRDYEESKRDLIRFICGNTEKVLVAKYEK